MRILLLGMVLLLGGCSVHPPKPWQKATLAKEIFTQGSCASEFSTIQSHVYFSKEASKGGGGVAGGGCGCN